MYNIQLIINDSKEKDKLASWINEELHTECEIVSHAEVTEPKILVIEINKLLDWMIIHRIRKQNRNLLVFPLINPNLLHTVPIAMQLESKYLFIKPLKKSSFIRNIKRVLNYDNTGTPLSDKEQECQAQLQEMFLRRVLRGEVSTEQEIIESKLFTENVIPNTVYFIQGFVRDQTREEQDGWQAPQIIQKFLKERLSKEVGQVFFVPYRKHLLMLLRIPSVFVSPRFWTEGESAILTVIEELVENYGIHLYIGAGSIYSEPQLLHHSYKEARIARRTPPYKRVQLRYFEETAKDPQIRKCIDYISTHYSEEILATRVAAHANFSPAYFSRLFKKENGISFVEYVTFVRLQRAIYHLRHTNLTIEQIAEDMGFNTPNYFSNTFKKYVGLSPSDYRSTKEIMFV